MNSSVEELTNMVTLHMAAEGIPTNVEAIKSIASILADGNACADDVRKILLAAERPILLTRVDEAA